ncbi:MAG: cytochrome c [Flavobacteriales bacterium]|nr:cytochrome c [Flavobacteriales bacterium]
MRYAGFILVVCGFAALHGCRFKPANKTGSQIYSDQCASCHGTKGEGLSRLVPPLNDPVRLAQLGDSLPCIIRYGVRGRAQFGYQPMPPFPSLEADDIALLWAYLWELAGHLDTSLSLAQVRKSGCVE